MNTRNVLNTLTALTLLTVAQSINGVPACAAMPQQKAEADSPAVTDLKAALLAGEMADKLFLDGKWAEALDAFNAAEAKFNTAIKRDSNIERLSINWTPASMPAACKYGFMQTRKSAPGLSSIEHNQTHLREDGMPVSEFRNMLLLMRRDALVFSGKSVPFVEDGDSKPDEIDIELMGRKAAALGLKLELPLPDDQWEGAIAALAHASLQLENILALNPKWKTEEMRNWGAIDKPDPTGNEALAIVKAKLVEAQGEVDKANTRLDKIVPANVAARLDILVSSLNTILERNNSGAYYDVDDAGIVGGATRAAVYKQLRPLFVEAYAKENKAVPADVMKPIDDKIAEVQAALDKKASGYTFETKTPAPAMIAESVKKAVQKAFSNAQVVRTGVRGEGWNIYRTDAGTITGRGREGSVLYKLPGEKWYREQLFTYVQDNTGGGSYAPNGRVGLGNLLRFENGK